MYLYTKLVSMQTKLHIILFINNIGAKFTNSFRNYNIG